MKKAEPGFLNRITANPEIMTGKPVIAGTRLTVDYIFNLLAHGASPEEILAEYQGLTRADLRACISYCGRLPDDPLR